MAVADPTDTVEVPQTTLDETVADLAAIFVSHNVGMDKRRLARESLERLAPYATSDVDNWIKGSGC
jgi:hypothetical protein